MAPFKCRALGCPTISDTSVVTNIRMFQFPKDLERCKKWVQLSGNIKLLDVPSEKLCKLRHLCALHFNDNDFANNVKNTLKRYKEVLPSSSLSYPPLSNEQMAVFPVTARKEKNNLTPCNKIKETVVHKNSGESLMITETPIAEESECEQISGVSGNVEMLTPLRQHVQQGSSLNRKRITKAWLARQAGVQMGQMTPKKRAILKIAHANHLARKRLQRRLHYAAKHAKALAVKLQNRKTTLLKNMSLSYGAQFVLQGDIRNYDRPNTSRLWTRTEKCYWLALYKRSPKAYRWLRQSITLPCEKSLRTILHDIKLQPGISPTLLKLMVKKLSVNSERAACIMFDEIFLSEHVSYNHCLNVIEGFEDLGSHGRTHKKANHILVFKVRDISTGFLLPIAFYAVNGTCPKETLAILISDVVRALRKNNIITVCTISDQGPTNRGALTILRSRCSEGECDPVYYVDDLRIIHLWDTPHLLKSIRNNLLTSDIAYENDKIAKWAHLIQFFKLDEGMCKISNLTYAHLCPLGRNKMRVNLALQAWGQKTWTGMKTFRSLSGGKVLGDCIPTVDFFELMDNLTDAVNGPGRQDSPKLNRCHVTSNSFHHQYWRDMALKIKSWVFIRKSNGEQHIPPCLLGMVDNLRGLAWVWKRLQQFHFTVMKLRDFNQDPLENYFGQIRQTCGSNTDPTVPQFIAGMKTLLVQHITAPLRDSNCTSNSHDNTTAINDLQSILNDVMTEPNTSGSTLLRGFDVPGDSALLPSNKLARQGPSITCATVRRDILRSVEQCKECAANLTTDEESSDFTLLRMRESTMSLGKPSPSLSNIFLLSQRQILAEWDTVAHQHKVRDTIMKRLSEEQCYDWVTCPIHSEKVKCLLKDFISMHIVTNHCANMNKSRKAQKKRNVRQEQWNPLKAPVNNDDGLDQIDHTDWSILTGMPKVNRTVAMHLQTTTNVLPSAQFLKEAIEKASEVSPEEEVGEQTSSQDQPAVITNLCSEQLNAEMSLLQDFETTMESDKAGQLPTSADISKLEGYVTAIITGQGNRLSMAQLRDVARHKSMKNFSRLRKHELHNYIASYLQNLD